MADAQMMKIGARYNWRNQPERMVYIGRKLYPGDRRHWHQFEQVGVPGIVWSEVLDSDLPMIEETPQATDLHGLIEEADAEIRAQHPREPHYLLPEQASLLDAASGVEGRKP